MRLIPALLATCLSVGSWWAIAPWAAEAAPAEGRHPPPPTPPAPPLPVPIPPAPPRPPAPAEMREAWNAALAGERLLRAGRLDEALANYRRASAVRYEHHQDEASLVHGIHLWMLATGLIRAGRPADAEPLLQAFEDSASPRLAATDSGVVAMIIDLRLYIAADRRDVRLILALIDRRSKLRSQTGPLGCPDPPYFPMIVAPMHHDERVAAALRGLGCDQVILDQVDRLAARPIGDIYPLPARR